MMAEPSFDAALVLFSGGQDSTVCLACCGDRPACKLRAEGFARFIATRGT